MSFQENLSKFTVKDLKLDQKVVVIDSSSSLEDGFESLVKANVLSAPVWDAASSSYTGFLDMRDLVSAVVFIAEAGGDADSTKTLRDVFVKAKYTGGAFTPTYFSRRNPFKSVTPDTSLAEVVRLLSTRGAGKVKRLAVLDGKGKVVNIISQSTIVAYLQDELLTHSRASDSVISLELGSAPVASVESSEPAIVAFRMMDRKNITGLAITEKGRMIGNISSRDIKIFIRHIDFATLAVPIGEFVKQLRMQELDIRTPTITVFGTHSFEYVVKKLAATRVHRVFVVDSEESFKAIRVVSLVDVLAKALE